MKTQAEVEAFLASLQAGLDGHTESKEWEDEQLGNMDALYDILDPDRFPYTFQNLKESIMKYMGYLRAMEWFEGKKPGWKFWNERFGGTIDPKQIWTCPQCGRHTIEIRGHNLWVATQNQYGHVLDHGNPEQLIVNLNCIRCGHEQHISQDSDLEAWKK